MSDEQFRSTAELTKAVETVASELNTDKSALFILLRWVLSGRSKGFEVPMIAVCLGKTHVLKRLQDSKSYFLKSQTANS